MQICFYDARITSDNTTIMVQEKSMDYEAGKLDNPEKIAKMMQTLLHMDAFAEEHCYMIALNTSCQILGVFFISKGTVNSSLVSPREIFIRALLSGAVCIVLCHNHPSKDTTPSRSDISMTKRIKEAGELMNISLCDHIIIGGNSYFSFKEAELL